MADFLIVIPENPKGIYRETIRRQGTPDLSGGEWLKGDTKYRHQICQAF